MIRRHAPRMSISPNIHFDDFWKMIKPGIQGNSNPIRATILKRARILINSPHHIFYWKAGIDTNDIHILICPQDCLHSIMHHKFEECEDQIEIYQSIGQILFNNEFIPLLFGGLQKIRRKIIKNPRCISIVAYNLIPPSSNIIKFQSSPCRKIHRIDKILNIIYLCLIFF